MFVFTLNFEMLNFERLSFDMLSVFMLSVMPPLFIRNTETFSSKKIIKTNFGQHGSQEMKPLVCFHPFVTSRNANWRGRLSTVDLLIKVTCFVKLLLIFAILKRADLNQLVRGGQMYWGFPFSKGSLVALQHGLVILWLLKATSWFTIFLTGSCLIKRFAAVIFNLVSACV